MKGSKTQIYYQDHLGHKIQIKHFRRIVSLVPSQTELLIDLGIANRLVGITNYCIHPEKGIERFTKIGGTKTPNIKKILSMKPDLILANKEENSKNHIEYFKNNGITVWVSDVMTYQDNEVLIRDFGILFNCKKKANNLANKIRKAWTTLHTNKKETCLYFIWRKPYMLAGQECFINSCLEKSGFINLIKTSRYPSQTIDQLKAFKPKYVFLATEPYLFKEKHKDEFQSIFPDSKIMVVNGELFSWFGSRQQYLPDYLNYKFTAQI